MVPGMEPAKDGIEDPDKTADMGIAPRAARIIKIYRISSKIHRHPKTRTRQSHGRTRHGTGVDKAREDLVTDGDNTKVQIAGAPATRRHGPGTKTMMVTRIMIPTPAKMEMREPNPKSAETSRTPKIIVLTKTRINAPGSIMP